MRPKYESERRLSFKERSTRQTDGEKKQKNLLTEKTASNKQHNNDAYSRYLKSDDLTTGVWKTAGQRGVKTLFRPT